MHTLTIHHHFHLVAARRISVHRTPRTAKTTHPLGQTSRENHPATQKPPTQPQWASALNDYQLIKLPGSASKWKAQNGFNFVA